MAARRVHVRRGAALERDLLVERVLSDDAEHGLVVGAKALDVLVDAYAVTQPARAAQAERLANGCGAVGLSRVDGDGHEVLAQQLECLAVQRGREAELGASDVEADAAAAAVGDGEFRDLVRPVEVTHRVEQRAHADAESRLGRLGDALLDAGLHGLDDLLEREPPSQVLLGCVAQLGIDDAVLGEVDDGLAGDARRGWRRSASRRWCGRMPRGSARASRSSALSTKMLASSAGSVEGSSCPISAASSMSVSGRTPPSRWSCSKTLGSVRMSSAVRVMATSLRRLLRNGRPEYGSEVRERQGDDERRRRPRRRLARGPIDAEQADRGGESEQPHSRCDRDEALGR